MAGAQDDCCASAAAPVGDGMLLPRLSGRAGKLRSTSRLYTAKHVACTRYRRPLAWPRHMPIKASLRWQQTWTPPDSSYPSTHIPRPHRCCVATRCCSPPPSTTSASPPRSRCGAGRDACAVVFEGPAGVRPRQACGRVAWDGMAACKDCTARKRRMPQCCTCTVIGPWTLELRLSRSRRLEPGPLLYP